VNARRRWQRTWEHVGLEPPPGLIDELLAAYSEPHRAYHTVDHLAECFGQLDASGIVPDAPATVELALWFHDAVYDTKANDNEARSAEWGRRVLGGLGVTCVDAVVSAILVTKHEGLPASDDEALLLDVDLSILGAPPERFRQYEEQIRAEYAWVPEEAYRAARRRILAGFLERPVLYRTQRFREQLEGRARENLTASIEALAS